jgi:16S rRNA (cytosine1402-N4)-methyltransferase
MVKEIVDSLLEPFRALPAGSPPHWLVDCTLGGGGHTGVFLEAFAREPGLRSHRILSIDRDLSAIARAKERFAAEISEGRLELVHACFSEAGQVIGERPVLGVLADLGFSSDQLDDSERGLSFQSDGPLDMRLDPSSGMTCRDLLSRATERELERILSEYGEERFARRIAAVIVSRRRQGLLPRTTRELADLVVYSVPPNARRGRIHAATRTFQAFRIAVNDELKELDSLLEHVILSVRPGGRVAVLSFHSLEDRKVKHAFRVKDTWRAITRKPIEADEVEIIQNPRSRSAKLRIAERTEAGS